LEKGGCVASHPILAEEINPKEHPRAVTATPKRKGPSMKRKPLDSRVLKQQVDIVALVGDFTKLRRVGREFVGLCPLHGERHPSFYVNPAKQVFHCFGCGAGGDVFDFVMHIEDLPFSSALEWVNDFLFRRESLEGIASASDPRSGSRFAGASERASLSAATQQGINSQSLRTSHAKVIAQVESTERRLRAIAKTNRAASAALATGCDPRDENLGPFIHQKPDNSSEEDKHGIRA
jgi:CHC2 zinc finger